MAERMTDIANSVCVDDHPKAAKQRCRDEDIGFILVTCGLGNGAIVVCRSARDAERLIALYGDRAHLRTRRDHC